MSIPFPVPSGNVAKDVQALMRWAQSLSTTTATTTTTTSASTETTRSVATPFTVSSSDQILFITITADHDVITLPTIQTGWATSSPVFTIIKVDSSGHTSYLTPPAGKTINGASTKTITNTQYEQYQVYTDGMEYYVTSSSPL